MQAFARPLEFLYRRPVVNLNRRERVVMRPQDFVAPHELRRLDRVGQAPKGRSNLRPSPRFPVLPSGAIESRKKEPPHGKGEALGTGSSLWSLRPFVATPSP